MDDDDLALRNSTYGLFVQLGRARASDEVSRATLSELAHTWWGDRLDPGWRPRTRAQNQGVLERLGLTREFWRLP